MDFLKYREETIVVIGLGLAFVFGRWTVAQTQTETIKKTAQTQTEEHKDARTTTHTVTTKRPDGFETIVVDSETSVVTDKDRVHNTETQVSATTTSKMPSKTNISAIIALDINNGYKHTYGVAVTREVLGPITVGVFALHTGVIGVSLGFDF